MLYQFFLMKTFLLQFRHQCFFVLNNLNVAMYTCKGYLLSTPLECIETTTPPSQDLCTEIEFNYMLYT